MDLIRVGSFELYPSERLLCSAGKPLELGARAFDLLLVLVESHGRLVTKGTLLERVWPRLVVEENNLPAQIASLRRVLGAGAIRTVPGYGYRLELKVSTGQGADQGPLPGSTDATGSTGAERAAPRLAVPRRAWTNRLEPLIGRDQDVDAIRSSLGRSCLVTIVGIAGVGKTRLAEEILAREIDGGACSAAWVSLAPLEQVGHVPPAIALAVGLSLPDGADGFAALRQALEDVPLLLVLDGAERLDDALAAPLAELIRQTRAVRVLVTSQAPLGIAGESVYRLGTLPVPDPGAAPRDAAQCGRSRCSRSGRRRRTGASSCRPRTPRSSPRSAGVWTAYRSPSNSRRPGSRRSGSGRCTKGSMTGSGC